MSDSDTATLPATPTTPRAAALDRLEALHALAAENVALVARLRSTQIPQHIGMAAACRALAVELPGMLMAHVEADLTSGVLAKRWDAVRAAAAESSVGDAAEQTIAAISCLLREQTRAVMRHLAARGKEWTAEAYRLEGQATALEAQVGRLRHVAAAEPQASANSANGSTAHGAAVSGSEANDGAAAAAG